MLQLLSQFSDAEFRLAYETLYQSLENKACTSLLSIPSSDPEQL